MDLERLLIINAMIEPKVAIRNSTLYPGIAGSGGEVLSISKYSL